ncbi:MAG: HAMP domain-containing histidine kinase [Thermodesulfovibrio sp.]|uniref:HAMP domain-containing histidine kinase n=1 Tax=Thermodesulfovibrio sp. N1 TaxID=1871110 RepID=UPI00083B37D8|nr:HAMP domain-containing histidine kinase [Thermodesulfovibrio sp. N1]MDI6713991.1 HAMP domain-containing histidine kinase [Thermodesulfovibrio sp.]
MSFQTKLLIIFAIIVVLIFSIINFVTLYFFNEEQQRHFEETLALYQKILEKDKNYPLPLHIKRYDKELIIDQNYIDDRFKKYAKTVLLWESLLVLLLMYLFYRVLVAISKKEIEYEEFLKLLIFVMSHKIGNFLSVMKTNLEILRIKPENRIIERLHTSCNILNEEITKTIETVKKLPAFRKDIKEINLKEILTKIISKFETRKKIILSLKDSLTKANEETIEIILFLIIDNAFKYSNSKIHIKIFKKFLAVRNDIAESDKGSGVGLQIVDYLAKKSGYTIKYRAKGEHFLLTLKF